MSDFVALAVAAFACVAVVSASGLAGLVLWLKHRELKLEHEPLVKLQRRLDDLEVLTTRIHNASELAKLSRR